MPTKFDVDINLPTEQLLARCIHANHTTAWCGECGVAKEVSILHIHLLDSTCCSLFRHHVHKSDSDDGEDLYGVWYTDPRLCWPTPLIKLGLMTDSSRYPYPHGVTDSGLFESWLITMQCTWIHNNSEGSFLLLSPPWSALQSIPHGLLENVSVKPCCSARISCKILSVSILIETWRQINIFYISRNGCLTNTFVTQSYSLHPGKHRILTNLTWYQGIQSTSVGLFQIAHLLLHGYIFLVNPCACQRCKCIVIAKYISRVSAQASDIAYELDMTETRSDLSHAFSYWVSITLEPI